MKSNILKNILLLVCVFGSIGLTIFISYQMASSENQNLFNQKFNLANNDREINNIEISGTQTNDSQTDHSPISVNGHLLSNQDGNNISTQEPSNEQVTATQEQLDYWQTLEPECSFTFEDGTSYEFIGTDRACGSSYYVSVIRNTDGTISLASMDPYNGSGGLAKWITFLEDGQIGFSCLAYSGGSLGAIYRTEDGGKTFQEITYPSPNIELADGTVYNPFVMPELVYEENGVLYMIAGQGPDGDYYGEKGFCDGVYESDDMGLSWNFLREAPNSSRE